MRQVFEFRHTHTQIVSSYAKENACQIQSEKKINKKILYKYWMDTKFIVTFGI